MPKRTHSPTPDSVPSVKYAHTAQAGRPKYHSISNFDTILSDETVLTIFAFLDPHHLCLAQLVNKHWSRLATDNHLWRIMFLREFSQQRLRGSRGFTTSRNREIRPLPSRAQTHDEEPTNDYLPENYTDWRWMFRISSNWSRGRCAAIIQQAGPYPTAGSSRNISSSIFPNDPAFCSHYLANLSFKAHLLLVGELTIYASGQASATPTVYIFRDIINSGIHISYEPPSGSQASVTALCLDHSSANIRLAVFYSDLTWAIHTIDYDHLTTALTYTCGRSTIPASGVPVIQAAYHHPLLVTLSSTFRMSIFYLPPAPDSPILKHTLSSYSVFTPLTMTLSRYRTPDQYRVLLAHASPIYPAHWGPSVTDMTLSTRPISSLDYLSPHASTSSSPVPSSSLVRIASSASTSNQLPVGWIPDGTPDGIPEELRLRWSRKVSHVSGIQTDGKFVVFASEDGGIQVYRLHRNARLLYERTLIPPEHAPSPRALSVADSRCVCATQDGKLWVWDLEHGVGIQAAAVRSSQISDIPVAGSRLDDEDKGDAPSKPPTIVRVAFDAQRIVVVDINNMLHTYSFDI